MNQFDSINLIAGGKKGDPPPNTKTKQRKRKLDEKSNQNKS